MPLPDDNCLTPQRPTVLVVDDEAAVRRILQARLQRAGFAVQPAADGAQAVALLGQLADPARMAFVDQNMPGLDGLETVAALRALQPDLPCCLMSGETHGPAGVDLAELGLAAVLPKPFDWDQVLSLLRRLAGGGAPRDSGLGARS